MCSPGRWERKESVVEWLFKKTSILQTDTVNQELSDPPYKSILDLFSANLLHKRQRAVRSEVEKKDLKFSGFQRGCNAFILCLRVFLKNNFHRTYIKFNKRLQPCRQLCEAAQCWCEMNANGSMLTSSYAKCKHHVEQLWDQYTVKCAKSSPMLAPVYLSVGIPSHHASWLKPANSSNNQAVTLHYLILQKKQNKTPTLIYPAT